MKTYSVKRLNHKKVPIGKRYKISINYKYYRHNDIIHMTNGEHAIVSTSWIKRHWQQIIVIAIYIIGIVLALFLSGCASQKISTDSRYKTFRYNIPSEYFFYQNKEIYNVSSKLDTTKLDRRDIKILKIDSLTIKYLEFKGNEARKRNDPKIAKEN